MGTRCFCLRNSTHRRNRAVRPGVLEIDRKAARDLVTSGNEARNQHVTRSCLWISAAPHGMERKPLVGMPSARSLDFRPRLSVDRSNVVVESDGNAYALLVESGLGPERFGGPAVQRPSRQF